MGSRSGGEGRGGVVVVGVLEEARVGVFHGRIDGWMAWFLALVHSLSLQLYFCSWLLLVWGEVPWLARGSYSGTEREKGVVESRDSDVVTGEGDTRQQQRLKLWRSFVLLTVVSGT
jgi:hypothetical protein